MSIQKLCKYLIFPLAIMVFVTSSTLFEPEPASAGLRVAGASLSTEASPGDILTHIFSVGIRDNDPPADIQIDVGGMGQTLNGTCEILDSSDLNVYSADQFITIDKSSFHLEPGSSQNVIATIHVPVDVGAGGRYAVINVRNQPVNESQVSIVSAINIPVYLTIKGPQLTHQGMITDVSISGPASGQPIHISTTFQNTGNHHFKLKGEITIADDRGQVLDIIHVASTPFPIIPSVSRLIEATYIPQKQLPSGVYSVKIKLMLENDTVMAESNSDFVVEEPYDSPKAANVMLNPKTISTLKMENGEILLFFPIGAVTEETEVSVVEIPMEQIPPLPQGYETASRAFRIDRRSGTLAREAVVTAKYTQADMEKANGEASRLQLARWDELKNKWQVLSTHVDTEMMSLSAESRQLGIFTILVTPHQTKTNRWPMIGIMTGIATICALAYYFITRRIGRLHKKNRS